MTALAANVMQFARILRRAGLAVGPGKVIAALEALQAIDIADREVVFYALHAVLVERHAQSELFRMAFERFWRANGGTAQSFLLEDAAKAEMQNPIARPMSRRIDEAFALRRTPHQSGPPGEIPEMIASWSAAERLRRQDFESMSAGEMAEAKRLMATLRLPIPDVLTRRYRTSPSGSRVDARATLRAMVRAGGVIALQRKRRVVRRPPLVVLCDISGSMAAYARMLLHFLHAVTIDRDRVQVFLFGTRLTNVTREMAHRDPDEALARVATSVKDWSGGTRIGQTLGEFNRLWSRRVLGQGALVLLISDGLDRDGGTGLAVEMQRLHRSCRRLIWLNPLLRYAAFEPKSAGIRAMLPHVDDFRPVHNLDSLAALIAALSAPPKADREAA
ncbi:MAG: VWA domain-containing protein [Rhodospirillaceae bacterium]|nr:VWA domain-containing protein [Rhodospirillaceae bacterium]